MRLAPAWGLLLGAMAPLAAQSDPAAFVQAVREATRRYADQSVAIADGYRKVGPDFPSMGEHWISVSRIVRGTVVPLEPPILEYAMLGGRPTLVGVAYAQLVREGLPTSSLPAPADAWHYHAGSVDEESFILGHASGEAASAAAGPRIAVLHAWVWIDNPAGLFATDNWALPFARLGLPLPTAAREPSEVTLAASLAGGGERYLATLLRLRHRLDDVESGRVDSVLAGHAAALRRALAAGSSSSALRQLQAGWRDLEHDLTDACPSCGLGSLGSLVHPETPRH